MAVGFVPYRSVSSVLASGARRFAALCFLAMVVRFCGWPGRAASASSTISSPLLCGCALPLLRASMSSSLTCLRGADRGRIQSDALERVGGRQGFARAAALRRTISVAHEWLPTLMANRWLPSAPATFSGVSSTSRRRPFDGLAVAYLFFSALSGPVPSSDEEGHGGGPLYSGGARGPDCFSRNLFRVFLAKDRDCSVLLLFVGVPDVICIFTAVN